MMSFENPRRAEKQSDPRLRLLLFHGVVCLLIVASLFVVKLIGGDVYAGVRGWYADYFEEETTLREVFGSEPSEPADETSSGQDGEPGEFVTPDASSSPDATSSDASSAESEAESEPQTSSAPEAAADAQGSAFDLAAVQTVKNTRLTSKNALLWPVQGTLTSGFGDRVDPFGSGKTVHHYGLDIAANTGTPVAAALDGVVSAVGYEANGYGHYIMLLHQNGFYTLYAHCSKILLSKGVTVAAGQAIAQVGSSGAATGPHLHFEIRVGAQKINPAWILSTGEPT